MCGIIGMAGDIDHEMRTRIFKDFLDTCASRGRDSTGVVRVHKNANEYSYAKQLGAPAYLYDSRQWDRHVDGEAQALIGHCRAKTIGDVSVRNAHPFDFPERGLIGVHNGTLRGQHNLDTYHHTKVDSEVLYGHLAQNGPEETFNKVEGAYACVWWDKEDEGTLNFMRNTERPLWFTWSHDHRVMYWASEIWMFGAIARKKKLWDGGPDGNVYHELPPHKLWSFRLNPNAKGEEMVLRMRPVKEINLEKKPTYQYQPPVGFHAGRNNSVRWKETSPGVHERSYNPNAYGGQNNPVHHLAKGGEVIDPFKVAGEKPVVTILDGEALDKELQRQGLTVSTAEENKSSSLSNVSFLRESVKQSGSPMGPNTTISSGKSTLSLPKKPSNIFPLKSKEEPSGSCETYSPKREGGLLKEGVSFRVVAGVPYITWNQTGREFTENELMVNTGGCCSFCKEPLNDIARVAEFLTEQRVICTTCLTEPSEDALYSMC